CRGSLLWFGGGDVLDDEDPFAGLDQAQFPARDFLDGARVVLQPSRFLAKPGVVGALLGDRGCELIVLLPRAQDREQAAVAHETVDDDHRRDEDEQPVDDAPRARRRFGRLRLRRASSGWSGRVLRHAVKTVQQLRSMYKVLL